jgi:tRNA(fMet)-specific endonuclease VapC
VTVYALDTNTLSCFLRGEGRVGQRLAGTPPRHVALPSVVVYEIRYGLKRVGRRPLEQAFEHMLRVATVLDFDAEAAEHAADIRQSLDQAGTPIGHHDLLIAATVRRHPCTLVTHNTREFARVPGLLLEDWY